MQHKLPCQWARVLVLGEQSAGKTALVRAVNEMPFKHTESTAGIDRIAQRRFKDSHEDQTSSIGMVMWDFGGSEVCVHPYVPCHGEVFFKCQIAPVNALIYL